MTPVQILEALQFQLRFNQDIQAQITDLREEQVLLMSYLREQDARRDLEQLDYERDMRDMNQWIDFLIHMRIYHQPTDS